MTDVRPASIPQGLKRDCDEPVALPDRPLGAADMALWGKDRAALGECRRRHKALAEAADALEGQGPGELGID